MHGIPIMSVHIFPCLTWLVIDVVLELLVDLSNFSLDFMTAIQYKWYMFY